MYCTDCGTGHDTPVNFCSHCGQRLKVPPPATPEQDPFEGLSGRLVRGYRFGCLVGEGPLGAVFEAVQCGLNRAVEIRALAPLLCLDSELMQRFKGVLESLAAIDSPFIVPQLDIFEDCGLVCVVTATTGTSLRDALDNDGPLGEVEAARVVRQAALGLWAANEHGFVHRDIKPENLILSRDGHLRIADFGLADLAESSVAMQGTGSIFGTPAYMSREQWEGVQVDHRSDLYALGCTLHELLTGETLFNAPLGMPLVAGLPSEREAGAVQSLTPRMQAIIERLVNDEPEERFQTGHELARELEKLIRPEPTVEVAQPLWIPPESPATGSSSRVGSSSSVVVALKMVHIPAGTFVMGSDPFETGRADDECAHKVVLAQAFYMKASLVTQAEFKAVMGSNPARFKSVGKSAPIEQVSWFDAIRYCNRLSEKEGLRPAYVIQGETVRFLGFNRTGYRLPTEAEWEYACRATTLTPYSTGRKLQAGDANFDQRETSQVMLYPPNPWGLHDMHGNVWEWCWDWYGRYPQTSVRQPCGPDKGETRLLRGGGWDSQARACRSASRSHFFPNMRTDAVGFRTVISVPGSRR